MRLSEPVGRVSIFHKKKDSNSIFVLVLRKICWDYQINIIVKSNQVRIDIGRPATCRNCGSFACAPLSERGGETKKLSENQTALLVAETGLEPVTFGL